MGDSAKTLARFQPGRRSNPGFAIAAAFALVLVLAGCATRPAAVSPSPSPSGAASSPTAPGSSPLALPTDEPPAPSPNEPASSAPSPISDGAVTVTIVSSGVDGQSLYASGLVTGAADPGGTCVLTASAAGTVLRAETEAQSTPAAVNCGLIEVAAPSGDWTLTLSYESGSARYVSEPTTVRQQ